MRPGPSDEQLELMDDLTVNSLLNTVSAVVIGGTIIICAAWIITSIVTSMKQRSNTRMRIDVYNRIIDKFATAPEFIEFLKSDAGLRFIEEQTVDVSQPLRGVLNSVRLGVSLTLIGTGMITVSNLWDWVLGKDLYIVLALGGTVSLAAGIGFIIAAFVSYKLCKAWGLIPTPDAQKQMNGD